MRQLKSWFSLPSHFLICSIYLADITWLKMKCVLSLHKTAYDSVYFYSDVPSDMPKYWSHFIAGKLAVLSRTALGGCFKHCCEGEIWGQVERWAEYPRLGILFFINIGQSVFHLPGGNLVPTSFLKKAASLDLGRRVQISWLTVGRIRG